MLFKTRKVRHSGRFSSRIRSGSRQRREYAATVYSTAVIQFILACTLLVAAWRSYQAIFAHASGVPVALKLALPLVFAAGALLVGRSAARNIGSARSMRHQGRDRESDDPDSPS